jgi:hypothetical protein
MSGDSGVLTVSRSGAGNKENEYAIGQAAVPDIVLEPVLRKMLDSDLRQAIVDVIRSEGTVVPVYIEKMEPTKEQAADYALRLELLDGRDHWQQIYYDSSKEPTKILVEQENTYTLKRADANEIATTFPERANLVRDRHQLLNREEL